MSLSILLLAYLSQANPIPSYRILSHLSIHLSTCLSMHLQSMYSSVRLSIYLLSIDRPTDLSNLLSIYLSMYLSVCLSILGLSRTRHARVRTSGQLSSPQLVIHWSTHVLPVNQGRLARQLHPDVETGSEASTWCSFRGLYPLAVLHECPQQFRQCSSERCVVGVSRLHIQAAKVRMASHPTPPAVVAPF